MKRNYGIDTARGLCMLYIVGIFHLTQYLGKNYYLLYNAVGNNIMCASLGTFSFLSGLLLGKKYVFASMKDVLYFYKKRVIRFYPLFIIATLLLWFIGMNSLYQSIIGLLGLSPFTSNQPMTLWYISMLIVFYFITPVCVNKYRLIISLGVCCITIIFHTFITLIFAFYTTLFCIFWEFVWQIILADS